VGRELLLEGHHLAAERELARLEDAADRRVDVRLDGAVLRLEVEERNHDCARCRRVYTVSPLPRMELVAASITSTTRWPSRPPVSGVSQWEMKLPKSQHDTRI